VDTIALIATIGGFVVTLAGLGANVIIAWLGRSQAVALAEKTHAHEREVARGDRLYESRGQVYEAMMKSVHAMIEHVEATEPIIGYSGEPDLPPDPTPEQQSRGHLRPTPARADAQRPPHR
jgi:hypothetical protein